MKSFITLAILSGLALSIWRGELGVWSLAVASSLYCAAAMYGGKRIDRLFGGRYE